MIWECPKRTQNRSRKKCKNRLDFGPPGASSGSLLALKMPPRPAQERPRHAQERSKMPPRPAQERPRGLPGRPKRPPRRLQEALRMPRRSRRPPGAIWDPFCFHFGHHLDAKTIPHRPADNCLRASYKTPPDTRTLPRTNQKPSPTPLNDDSTCR